MTKKVKLCRLVSLVVVLTMIFAFASTFSVFAETQSEEPLATLLFGSDYQYEPKYSPGTMMSTSKKLYSAVKADFPKVDLAVFCGDYTAIANKYNYNADASSSISSIKNFVSRYLYNTTETMFLQGNHDLYDSSIMAANGPVENENYIIYVMNTESANPWSQGIKSGSEDIVKAAAAALKDYLSSLIEKGETRPVIIATHVPLHMSPRTSKMEDSRTGDNKYNAYLFDVLNEAGKDLDIIYMYGHNHANGYDSYLGGSCVYRGIGSTLAVPVTDGYEDVPYTNNFKLRTLNFTYMNAGFMGYNAESSSCGEVTVSVVNIYKDKIELSRYNTSGKTHIGAKGEYNLIGFYGRLNDSLGYKDEEGKTFLKYPLSEETEGSATVERTSVTGSLRGLITDADGNIRYYKNGKAVAKGLVSDNDGNLYFIGSDNAAITNREFPISKMSGNGLLPAGKYNFDENGKITDTTLKNWICLDDDGEHRFYRWGEVNGEGVVKDDDGNFRYFDWSGVSKKNCRLYIYEDYANDLVLPGYFNIDENGFITGITSKPAKDKEGTFWFFENGDVGYMENNFFAKKGIVKDPDGNIYFFGKDKKAVREQMFTISEKDAKGLVPAGTYWFDENGILHECNGLMPDSRGELRYYENSNPVAKGLVKDENGDYYFVNSSLKVVKNTWYAFNSAYSNGLLPAGRYYFGEDGKLVFTNGIVKDNNGDIRCYENGVAVAKGLVEYEGSYYFINSTLKAVKNTYYAFSSKFANGLLPAGRYYFGEDGKLAA